MPPFYRGEKPRNQGHTGHLTSVSSAFNPPAAFAFSASSLFREGLVFSPGRSPPLKGGPWRTATHPIRFFSERPPPFHLARLLQGPCHSTSSRANSNFPSVPRAGRVRYEEPRASGGLGEEEAEGEGRGARSPQPRRVWAANARPRGARAAASGRRPRVRAGCGVARQETASHGARGRPGRRRGPQREKAWGGRGVAFLPMPGAT